MKKITCGVPQGSILGPLLFLLYINDKASVTNILSSILFADDTTLFCSSKNLQELTAIVTNELGNIMEWLNANKLSLNINKTNFMLFIPKGKNEICPSIHICGANIIEVDRSKFLGIVIGNRLNWVEHVKCISRKIAKGIGIIIKARKSFESETLLNLYNALIFPYISYGIQVWGTAAALHLHRLHVLQKKIIIPLAQRSCWGVYWFHSVRPSVCPSVRPSVPRPSRIPCPLCSFYSSGWILFIFRHLIKQLQKVCRVQSFLQNGKNLKFWQFFNI